MAILDSQVEKLSVCVRTDFELQNKVIVITPVSRGLMRESIWYVQETL